MSTPRPADLDTCVYCPKLCRHVCPVAVGTGREAAAPSNMALHPWRFLRGDGSVALARAAASLCVSCGACTEHCDLDRPLGTLLAEVRQHLGPPPVPAPLGELEGTGRRVAIEEDDRPWAEALAARLDEPVARLRTADHLGAAHLAHPLSDDAHARRLQRLLAGRIAVVADHRTAAALTDLGLAVEHLLDHVDLDGEPGTPHHPCAGPRLSGETAPLALACCGAREDLPGAWPDAADRVAAAQARRLQEHADDDGPLRSPDCTCAAAMRAAGVEVRDPVDALLHPAP